ncbi:uncharacterized protein [Montipora capricornis]
MSNELQTPKVAVTDESEDVTQKERSPAENAFYESFLIQSRSAIENLYASNIYHSQRHAKQVKDLERQKQYSMLQMNNNQKEMVKKMVHLKEKQGQIMAEKRKQFLKASITKSDGRIRPRSTSSVPDYDLRMLRHRHRSGSLPLLEPTDSAHTSQNLSGSSQNIETDSNSLRATLSRGLLSRSCEALSTLDKKNDRVVFPALSTSPRSLAKEPLEDTDFPFITRIEASPTNQPKLNLRLPLSSHQLEHRRRSLDPSVIRNLDSRRGVKTQTLGSATKSTHTKWIPKSCRSSQSGRLPSV